MTESLWIMERHDTFPLPKKDSNFGNASHLNVNIRPGHFFYNVFFCSGRPFCSLPKRKCNSFRKWVEFHFRERWPCVNEGKPLPYVVRLFPSAKESIFLLEEGSQITPWKKLFGAVLHANDGIFLEAKFRYSMFRKLSGMFDVMILRSFLLLLNWRLNLVSTKKERFSEEREHFAFGGMSALEKRMPLPPERTDETQNLQSRLTWDPHLFEERLSLLPKRCTLLQDAEATKDFYRCAGTTSTRAIQHALWMPHNDPVASMKGFLSRSATDIVWLRLLPVSSTLARVSTVRGSGTAASSQPWLVVRGVHAPTQVMSPTSPMTLSWTRHRMMMVLQETLRNLTFNWKLRCESLLGQLGLQKSTRLPVASGVLIHFGPTAEQAGACRRH